MSRKLDGKIALVTGGNSGIGLGMADALAAAGADVAIWGTNATKNDEAVAALVAHGTRVIGLRCDVGDEGEVERAFASTVEALGHVDACFVNAGVSGGAPSLHEMSLEEWRRVMRVNLDGAFLTCRAALTHMVERGRGGSLALTTSGSSIMGAARFQHYGASKAGVSSLMRGIAVEYARHGIRANAILPGWIETPMTEDSMGNERFVDKVLPRVPLRRWGEPGDFGGVAVYLASDASRYHTGDVLVLDGGYAIF